MPKALLIHNGRLRIFAYTFVTSFRQIYHLRFLPCGATFRVRSTFHTCSNSCHKPTSCLFFSFDCPCITSYNSSVFTFKNINASRVSGDRQARQRLQIDPASEKTRSDGADVVGIIPRYFRAARVSALKRASLAFHHCSVSTSRGC